MKEWWKCKSSYNPLPKHTSALELSENQKFWAKNDEVKLGDVKEEGAPIDPFKKTHEKRIFKNNVSEKI